MGVTGLWSIVQPCARPIKIETLNRKRLAVDASIWIYQFLKAVRDKEGNALRNSHVVGFFRRICKLLFFGIKPVFVFDGGAPALKRETITGRKQRREGRREDAVRTAGRLLAVQMQRRAEEADRSRREDLERGRRAPLPDEEEAMPENLVYVDEIQMTAQERQQNRQFKKKDQYHLPNLDVSLADMGAPNDPRIMSHEELEEYARQFHTGEDVNVYDFSKIDFNGPFFQTLPASDRYNILNAARLRSRLRMGYSKEQLDVMFPDRMAFSKFQVERVRERNELTQRLMNINGMNGEEMFNGGGRVAGEKGKEYVLVKNDGVEGGWALGVVSNKSEGQRNKPIDVDGLDRPPVPEEEISEEDGFEDVPIEGLNRLPKRGRARTPVHNDDYDPEAMSKRRRALYEKRLEAALRQESSKGSKEVQEVAEPGTDSLFLPEEITEQDLDGNEDDRALFEDVPPPIDDEDEELKRAIAMSMENPDGGEKSDQEISKFVDSYTGPRIDQPLDFNQTNAKIGRNFAHLTNARAQKSAPDAFKDQSDEEDDFNLQAALEESRQSKRKPTSGPRVHGFKRPDETFGSVSTISHGKQPDPSAPAGPPTSPPSQHHGFGGPLPFESLNLGTSILKRKKKEPVPEDEAGGFERESEERELPQFRKEKPPQPLPPWFTGDIRRDKAAEAARDAEERQHDGDGVSQSQTDPLLLRRHETGEVIDLDAPPKESEEVITVESSGDEDNDEDMMGNSGPVDNEVKMDDVAELTRTEPPTSAMPPSDAKPLGLADEERSHVLPTTEGNLDEKVPAQAGTEQDSESEAPVEWEESDYEADTEKRPAETHVVSPTGGKVQLQPSKSPSPDFEDVEAPAPPQKSLTPPFTNEIVPNLPQNMSIDAFQAEDEAAYSDSDEDLMRQLAVEAEEHARFASSLNAKPQAQNAEEYEKELRQLRNQQKKDRRDADEVTHVMVTECQQLLKLFGLPYITAPMEAEAQCAELVALGLVDGIVTDDSDIFLFGGTRVYKNMFNQAKFVECYLTADLEKEYSLDRKKLIGVAHLLGSDYTEGIPSVGPVTALEILSEFETLEQFVEWCNSVQLAQKLSPEDSTNAFRRKFRKQAQKLFLPSQFPDRRVDVAYLKPEVDSDPSAFEWGVPDLDALRSFLMATIGWTQERTDEVLVPVIRDMNRRDVEGTQANITQFFSGGTGTGTTQPAKGDGNSGFAPRRRVEGKSKRMESALGKLHERARQRTLPDGDDGAVEGNAGGAPATDDGTGKEQNHVKPSKNGRKRTAPSEMLAGSPDDSTGEDVYEAPKKARKVARKINRGKAGKS
ncbi:MAG: hypothetical protein LQ348_006419 [Seirophora lacunosa]|nr:MAG: hypothetical protein LQ348_006419 [Seirophora lacunosa]